MRPGFVFATPCSVATTGARSSVIPPTNSGWAITLTNASGSKSARRLSDSMADTSSGSMASANGIPTMRNAAPGFLFDKWDIS